MNKVCYGWRDQRTFIFSQTTWLNKDHMLLITWSIARCESRSRLVHIMYWYSLTLECIYKSISMYSQEKKTTKIKKTKAVFRLVEQLQCFTCPRFLSAMPFQSVWDRRLTYIVGSGQTILRLKKTCPLFNSDDLKKEISSLASFSLFPAIGGTLSS